MSGVTGRRANGRAHGRLLFAVSVAIGALAGCGGRDGGASSSPPVQQASQPAYQPAPKGDPEGDAHSQIVDSAGGTVMSADGRLELTIPAGALAGSTTVSIQPITNTAPNGAGLAYRLEPEGTTFSSPVRLAFHLTATEALGIDSGFIATQRNDGLWASQPGQTRDARARTVSVQASHFSDWSFLQTLQLKPLSTRVRVGATQDFEPSILYDPTLEDELTDPHGAEMTALVPTHFAHQLTSETGRHWTVNAINGGNTVVGRVVQQGDNGHYTAPNIVPSPSKVAVSLTVELGNAHVVAPAEVQVYSQERWTGTSDIVLLDGSKLTANWTFVQSGDPIDGEYTLDVESGKVEYIPIESQNGCPLTVSPLSHDIVPGEGSMTVTYDLTTGPENATVTGYGITVWPAIYTLHCPVGPKDIPGTVDGQWWPTNGAEAVEAVGGGVDISVGNGLASGHVHLKRD
jgi:hypothetical protein